MQHFFQVLDLPIAYNLNTSQLKKNYLLKSKSNHPDYYNQADATTYTNILSQTELINEAYSTLLVPHKRLKLILEIFGKINIDDKHSLSKAFLMEMMEVNEEIENAKQSANENEKQQLEKTLENLIEKLYKTIELHCEKNNYETWTESQWEQLKEKYYELKYLLRIQENLDSFAAL